MAISDDALETIGTRSFPLGNPGSATGPDAPK